MLDMTDPKFAEKLDFELNSTGGSSDYSNDRNRPYNGQPQTDQGERGRTLVEGLTMRDIVDCFVKGLLLCTGCDQPELYEKVENGTWRYRDVYKVNFDNIDPIAHSQNMMCEVERMMGIFPNLPKNMPTVEEWLNNPDGFKYQPPER